MSPIRSSFAGLSSRGYSSDSVAQGYWDTLSSSFRMYTGPTTYTSYSILPSPTMNPLTDPLGTAARMSWDNSGNMYIGTVVSGTATGVNTAMPALKYDSNTNVFSSIGNGNNTIVRNVLWDSRNSRLALVAGRTDSTTAALYVNGPVTNGAFTKAPSSGTQAVWFYPSTGTSNNDWSGTGYNNTTIQPTDVAININGANSYYGVCSSSTAGHIRTFDATLSSAGSATNTTNAPIIRVVYNNNTDYAVMGAFTTMAGSTRTGYALYTNSSIGSNAGFGPTTMTASTKVFDGIYLNNKWYFVGSFTSLGSNAGQKGLAVYDRSLNVDTSWPTQTGVGIVGTAITSIAVGANGMIYIAGSFSSVDGVAANNIAKYDPNTATFSPLGTGTNGAVYSISVKPGTNEVYCFGGFTTAGGKSTTGFAKYVDV